MAIYGAGSAGNQLASALKQTRDCRPVAFINDNKELQGATIAGIKVYGFDALPQLIVNRGIKEVLLAMPSLSKNQQKHVLERLAPLKVKIKMTPPLGDLVNGKGAVRLQDVREIEIEDLLGRDQVEPDSRLIAACITGKSVMVSGAGGGDRVRVVPPDTAPPAHQADFAGDVGVRAVFHRARVALEAEEAGQHG